MWYWIDFYLWCLLTFVLTQKDARITTKNWKLTLGKRVTVETFVLSHRWFNGFKIHWSLNRIKVSIGVVKDNRAAKNSPQHFPGTLRVITSQEVFIWKKFDLFGKRMPILPLYVYSKWWNYRHKLLPITLNLGSGGFLSSSLEPCSYVDNWFALYSKQLNFWVTPLFWMIWKALFLHFYFIFKISFSGENEI